MEELGVRFWQNKTVLVTGHTGFKGAWLTLWLLQLGARVTGMALPPETRPSLFDQLKLAREIDHRLVDIRDQAAVADTIAEVAPDVVFHLAAQALVLRSYCRPIETLAVNVMGTAHVLEALRALDKPCVAVLVTTDKVYQNREWQFGYRETDRLGGHDPYSASKAASEFVIHCWRHSFFDGVSPLRIGSVRAGNVIGGGDWAENRIVPDMVRALGAGRGIEVRNPNATRPWQHVLEPLGGYIRLAERLIESDDPQFQDAFNFGPSADAERTVRELVEESLQHWPGSWTDVSRTNQPHEAGRLALCIDRARTRLGWSPRWDFRRSVRETIDWYRTSMQATPRRLMERSLDQIADYEASLVPCMAL